MRVQRSQYFPQLFSAECARLSTRWLDDKCSDWPWTVFTDTVRITARYSIASISLHPKIIQNQTPANISLKFNSRGTYKGLFQAYKWNTNTSSHPLSTIDQSCDSTTKWNIQSLNWYIDNNVMMLPLKRQNFDMPSIRGTIYYTIRPRRLLSSPLFNVLRRCPKSKYHEYISREKSSKFTHCVKQIAYQVKTRDCHHELLCDMLIMTDMVICCLYTSSSYPDLYYILMIIDIIETVLFLDVEVAMHAGCDLAVLISNSINQTGYMLRKLTV